MHPAIENQVDFVTKEVKVFGTRTFWHCRICGKDGADEPGIHKSAEETVLEHFALAQAHLEVLRIVKPKSKLAGALAECMFEEMHIYGQMSARDASAIAAMIAKDFYASELRERDDKIEVLTRALEEAKALVLK